MHVFFETEEVYDITPTRVFLSPLLIQNLNIWYFPFQSKHLSTKLNKFEHEGLGMKIQKKCPKWAIYVVKQQNQNFQKSAKNPILVRS